MKRIWIVACAVVILGGVGLLVVRHRAAKPADPTAPQMATVERGAVRRTVSSDGYLRALTTVSLASDVGGKVVRLAVKVGDQVKKGDLIAQIDPTDTQTAYTQAVAALQSTRAQLDEARLQARAQPALSRTTVAQAQAAYDAAQMDLRRLETSTQLRDRTDARSGLDKAIAAVRGAQEDLTRMTATTHPVAKDQARSNLDQATAALRQAQENLKRLKAATHPQALAQARSDMDKAKSNLAVAEKELKRATALNARGYVSQSSLDSTANQYDTAKATYDQAQEKVRTIADDQSAEIRASEAQVAQAQAASEGARSAWVAIDRDQAAETHSAEAKVQQAEADLAAAQRKWGTIDQDQSAELAAIRAKLRQAEGSLGNARANSVQDRVKTVEVSNQQGQLSRQQATVDQTRTQLSYAIVTAPRDGVILEKDVEEGAIVNSGRSGIAEGVTIVKLGDLSTMFVDVSVDETDLPDIQAGQKVEIGVESVGDTKISGLVTRVDPQATTTSSITTVKVEIKVVDHDPRLLPGLSATCTFLAGEKNDVLTLPVRAIRQRDGKHYVTVPGAATSVEMPVEIGLEGNDTVEIVSGLKEGDKVLLPQIGTSQSKDFGPPPGGGADFVKK